MKKKKTSKTFYLLKEDENHLGKKYFYSFKITLDKSNSITVMNRKESKSTVKNILKSHVFFIENIKANIK